MDICFIKPQDLLDLSIAICTWHFAKDKRLSRSEILEEYSAHWQERHEGDETLESKTSVGDGARSRLDDRPARVGWNLKERKEKHLRSQTKCDISQKKKYLHKYKPSD
jgi:hypothetical protein